jgi:hypothetical protein
MNFDHSSDSEDESDQLSAYLYPDVTNLMSTNDLLQFICNSINLEQGSETGKLNLNAGIFGFIRNIFGSAFAEKVFRLSFIHSKNFILLKVWAPVLFENFSIPLIY